MDLAQLLLILIGLAIIAGGGAMLLRGAGRDTSGVPRPYIPLGVMAAGIVIAYLAYSEYKTMDSLEVVGLFLFGLAFAGAVAIKLFVADKVVAGGGNQDRNPHAPAAPSDTMDKDAGGRGS
jgi:hypothetical protein